MLSASNAGNIAIVGKSNEEELTLCKEALQKNQHSQSAMMGLFKLPAADVCLNKWTATKR